MDKSLATLNQENLELKKLNSGLNETVAILMSEVERLRALEKPVSNVERIELTTEQKIIEDQISLLDTISRMRAFTLEETRALDLLIKNKRLLDQNKPIEPDYTKVPDGQTPEDLIRIAGNAEPEQPTTTKPRAKTSSKNSMA